MSEVPTHFKDGCVYRYTFHSGNCVLVKCREYAIDNKVFEFVLFNDENIIFKYFHNEESPSKNWELLSDHEVQSIEFGIL